LRGLEPLAQRRGARSHGPEPQPDFGSPFFAASSASFAARNLALRRSA
jgi:hypothetical protein